MKSITKIKCLKKDVSEKNKKIFAELDDLIIELQSASLPLIEKIIIDARKTLNQEC